MKRLFLIILLGHFLISCSTKTAKGQVLDKNLLLTNLETLSSDEFEGRGFATAGNYKAQEFIAKQFKDLAVEPAFEQGFIQKFPYTFKGEMRKRLFPLAAPLDSTQNVPDTTLYGGNVLALLKGQSKKTIIITAHLDHLGIKKGQIYNGADDDASGVAALIAIAAYFKDKPIKHTMLIAAVDAEEIGSLGAEYLINNLPNDIDKLVLNINLDMIAHNDSLELFASGLYHYPQLKAPLENNDTPIRLLFGHDDPTNKDQDDWTFSSDHRVFHKNEIPFIYFGVEDHKDYHKPTDDFVNINQEFYI